MSDQPVLNTDREIYRGPSRAEWGDDDRFYADSIHVTESGGIGFNCGGHVIVMPLRKWFEAAQAELRHQSGQQDPRRFTLTEKRAPSQTDVDYAVEHAGYLATAAQSLLATCGARDLACQELEEVEESADCSSGARLAMERANESYGDALHAMRDAIYEFEKRRDRALQSVAGKKP